MDDAIRQAIADLSALIKDADSEDAERIRQIVESLFVDVRRKPPPRVALMVC
jgi:hypothetical protein